MKKILMAVLLVGLFAGCSSTINRGGDEATAGSVPQHQPAPSVGAVRIAFTDGGEKATAEHHEFDPDKLLQMLKRKLQAASHWDESSGFQVQVTVKDVRVRSAFSAAMFGFMAGDDHLVGDVAVVDREGRPLEQFEVSVSYALGGLVGGQDSTRMSWLYEEFANQTVAELTGKPLPEKKGSGIEL